MFVHVVFFYMPDDAPAGSQQQLASECRRLLSKVPGLIDFQIGRPAMTPREVVDNGYDLGLLTTFADSAAHDVYQTHPLHLEFVALNKQLFGRVQIYDFDTSR